jgi:hypothetical protein
MPCGHSLRACLDQQAEGIQPAVLCQRGQNRDGAPLFHGSMIIEMIGTVNRHFK